MKKYKFLFLTLLLGFLFFPIDAFAETSISYVPSAVAYFDFCGTSNNCGSANSYAQTTTLPIYPINFYNVNYNSFTHHGLQFNFESPTSFTDLKAYSFKVAFNYSASGMSKLYHTESLTGGVYPNGNIGVVQNKEISITTSNDSSNNRIIIEGTITLNELVNVSTFMVDLSGTLFACSNYSGSMLSTCGPDIVTQLSLLAVEVTPIVETDDLLLNGIVNNTRVTNEKLDELIGEFTETNDKLDDLNDSINNDDISGATSTGNDFFDNFNSSDNGGISGIITAPLNAINAMLNGTCQPLSTTFKGKTISLQCGTDMWDKLSGIRDFLNLVLGGLLCYRICLKIFHIVQNLKNPDNDKVEVMNL